MAKRRWMWVVVVSVGLLAAAAFLGMRLLNRGLGEAASLSGLVLTGGDPVARSISLEKAEGVPDREADLVGELVERDDNRLTVRQFVGMDGPGGSTGPEFEVVVTAETGVYRDATLDRLSGPPNASPALQQVLEPTSADGIDPGAMLMVWGYTRGDRLIAEFLIHKQGMVIR